MIRHNQGSATTPNAPMDLTPLLDVVFIVLFVVIIFSAQKTKDIQNEIKKEYDSKNAETEKIIADKDKLISGLKSDKGGLSEENFKLRTKLNAAYAYGKQSNSIGERVLIVDIHCEAWDGDSEGRRSLIINSPEGTLLEFEFSDKNKETSYERIKTRLQEYIDDHYEDGKKDTVILLSINNNDILTKDRIAIANMISDFTDKYPNVY